MKSSVDFLIMLKQLDEPKTIEQMKRINCGIFSEFIQDSIDNKLIEVISKTPLGIDLYYLSDDGEKLVLEEIKKRNNN